jgi:hypothetical protein
MLCLSLLVSSEVPLMLQNDKHEKHRQHMEATESLLVSSATVSFGMSYTVLQAGTTLIHVDQ